MLERFRGGWKPRVRRPARAREVIQAVLQVVHRVSRRFLLDQAGLKADEADSGAVTLIQRFGSAANVNIHLHCLVLAGLYTPSSSSGRPCAATQSSSRRAART